ncbi:hypothetical protein PRIPAC_91700 [Pristionchus pacificus]|uniref:Uncharacterized protein n=1 Tax=Pristionchus pacificus TaxID=54126 RepID=A0A2A6CIK7_PRIPA|nr:hypothetical protein PRIPAC_91700 [Pristionchus pacificus]|eukprot:PDM77907.1 hypothetical protein PRIPAC_34774 [Pristionchus pacificus]
MIYPLPGEGKIRKEGQMLQIPGRGKDGEGDVMSVASEPLTVMILPMCHEERGVFPDSSIMSTMAPGLGEMDEDRYE